MPPKPSIFLALWKDSRPGPGKCAFWQKVALLLFFTLFAKITHFHDFQDFGISHWKTLIYRYTGCRFLGKVAWTLPESSAFAQKGKMMKISILAKFQILVKIAQNAEMYQLFMLFHWENKAFSPSWIFLIILLTFLEIPKIPRFFVILMKFPSKS